MKKSFIIGLFKKFAEEAGVEMRIEEEYGFVAQLTLPSGAVRTIGTHIDGVNSAGASMLARDKTFSLSFLKRMGYPVPEGRAFFTDHYCRFLESEKNGAAAWEYAKQLGFPLILKPNSKSQGRGVWKVHSREEFFAALKDFEQWIDMFRVEQCATGRDIRIVVYHDRVICAYERIPFHIVGDGISVVNDLLRQKNSMWKQNGRSVFFQKDDARTAYILNKNNLTLSSVLEKGRTLMLLENANLSSGGDAIDVTDTIHPSYIKDAIGMARDMNLALCGIDMMIDDPVADASPYVVLELNAGPGLAHYASLGQRQYERARALYRAIFESLITT